MVIQDYIKQPGAYSSYIEETFHRYYCI